MKLLLMENPSIFVLITKKLLSKIGNKNIHKKMTNIQTQKIIEINTTTNIITNINPHNEERDIFIQDVSFVGMTKILFPLQTIYFFTPFPMNTEIIVHASEFQNEAEYIHNEMEKNISGKLDAYIKKTANEGDKIRAEITLTRDKLGSS